MLPEKYKKLDRIILNKQDLDFINNNIENDKVTEIQTPLPKGILIIEKLINGKEAYFPFLVDELNQKIKMEIYTEELGTIKVAEVESNNFGEVDIISQSSHWNFSNEQRKIFTNEIKMLGKHGMHTLLKIFYLMNTYRETKVIHTSKSLVEPKKNINNKKKHKKVRKIKRTIYQIATDQLKEIQDLEKRKYERHTNNWTRRGHWRLYKNGKRVWIKPTTIEVKTVESPSEKTNIPVEYRL